MEFVPGVYADSAETTESFSEYTFLPDWNSSNWDRLLEHTQTQMFSPGDIVVRAGSSDRALYIVAFGRVGMFVNPKKRLLIGFAKRRMVPLMASVESGSVVNALTFLDGRPGFATYQATTECQLLYFSFDAFTIFSAHRPELGRDILLDLGRLLALQVRRMSSLLASYGGDK